MKLHEYPTANRELKDHSLREQMEARLRQIDVHHFYPDKVIARMSDYALLMAFESTFKGICYNSTDEYYADGFSDASEIAKQKQSRMSNDTFPMKAGESLVYPTDSE